MNSKRVNARLIALCVLGCVLLSYPLMAIFNSPKLIFGVPVLHAYLFGMWLAFIVLLALIVDSPRKPPGA